MTNTNEEYSAPPRNYQEQTFGNLPNQFVKNDKDSGVRFQIQEELKKVRTNIPGIVQKSFERNGAVWCEVQPAISGELRNRKEFRLPVIRAPLARINIAGLQIDIPSPVNGDEVEIMCSDRSIATFIKDAGVGVPQTLSILNLNNAWKLPVSMSNFKRKRVGDDDKLTITFKGQKVEFTDSGTIINGGTRKASGVDDKTISSIAEDSAFWSFMAAFYGIITGPSINEPGNGNPSALQAALAAAISGVGGTPTSMEGKITTGSDDLLIT